MFSKKCTNDRKKNLTVHLLEKKNMYMNLYINNSYTCISCKTRLSQSDQSSQSTPPPWPVLPCFDCLNHLFNSPESPMMACSHLIREKGNRLSWENLEMQKSGPEHQEKFWGCENRSRPPRDTGESSLSLYHRVDCFALTVKNCMGFCIPISG